MENRDAQVSEIWKTWKQKLKDKAVDYLQGDDFTEQQFRFDPKELQRFWSSVDKLQDLLIKVYDYSYALGKFVDKDKSLENIFQPLYKIANNATQSASVLAKLKNYMKVPQMIEEKETVKQPEQKQENIPTEQVQQVVNVSQQDVDDAVTALRKIGYNKTDSTNAVDVVTKLNPNLNASEIVTTAIKYLKG